MKRISIFSYDIHEKKHVGVVSDLPKLRDFLLTLEEEVRRKSSPGALKNPAHILEESVLFPIRDYFVRQVACLSGVSEESVSCPRSWCFIARRNEYVFFDRKQWWVHQQPSTETGIHNHLPFHFTGVYYVNVAIGCEQPIIFLNPIASSFGRKDWYKYLPEQDTFIIFESQLWHRVPSVELSSESRIAISMDAVVFA